MSKIEELKDYLRKWRIGLKENPDRYKQYFPIIEKIKLDIKKYE